ncbi:MAG: glycosyltransferase family 4 protein [Candidatus Methylomirabilis oxygeniifera]|uniref:Putative Glycosyl transferase, group 1 n=1 Tax=Methylomirabilis oxygeniifera TaxID=671143 RepID=D5MIG3_METO1|nr:MAG: glycosyltransferase family 4 protein [Candidatus Methylomirabilis oxyfera]CBE67313.1 putative Glycosyl transferase, group 1 [Candidatus Methylomirabilis oxyfera]
MSTDRCIRVIHLITKLDGGAGANTLLTAIGLKRLGFDVTMGGSPGGELYADAERAGIRTIVLPHMRPSVSPLHDCIMLIQLLRLFRRERFTIVHTHSSKAGVLGRVAAACAGVPIIIHSVHGFAFHDLTQSISKWLWVWIERLCGRLCKKMLFVSRLLAEDAVARRICNIEDTEVIYSAIDLDAIADVSCEAAVKAWFGIPAEDSVVASVGRLDKKKNIVDLLVAAEVVLREHPATTFLVVGEGPEYDALIERAQALGISKKIIFSGHRTDLPRILAGIDIYAVPSLYEGMGRAMTEAMASGKPVVANAVGGIPELVIDGETGFLVAARRPEMMAEKILYLLSHPGEARVMGENARKIVGREFHPEMMVRRIAECYETLLREIGVSITSTGKCLRKS